MLLSKLFQFILLTSARFKIDESHGISHSMNVLHYANKIYESEIPKLPGLKDYEKTIYISALIHDMCDKKYMKEAEGIANIELFLNETLMPFELQTTKQIISTMSYSTVKKNGFPMMSDAEKQMAYHVVREADILTAYDFDRSMLYHMHNAHVDINQAFDNAIDLFEKRIFKHNEHGLLLTEFSKRESVVLQQTAMQRISAWKRILKNPLLM